MAHEKLSPRQKMIGMMYLVLTAMLALNVSKEAVEAFKRVDQGLTLSIANYAIKNNIIYSDFDRAAAENPTKAGKYKIAAYQVKERADEAFNFMQGLKKEIIIKAEGAETAAVKGDEIILDELDKKIDDTNIPSEILIGANESGKANDLKALLNDYRDFLITTLEGKNPTAEEVIRKSLNTDDGRDPDGQPTKWENMTFQTLPLVAVITILSELQLNVRNAETEVLNSLYSQIDASSFKFNKLRAIVIPNANYVTMGNDYEAKVFISATDTTQSPEITVGGVKIPVDDSGKGTYKVRATSVGPKKWGGIIALRAPDGSIKNYDFSADYVVGESNLIVSATAVNVMYMGIDNPIDVSVPGINPDKIRVKVVNGTVTTGKVKNAKGDNFKGNWAVKPNAAGQNVQVLVSADVDGKPVQYPPYEFRVKPLPKPVAVFGGKSTGTISRATAAAQQGVFAIMPDFDFELFYTVTGFSVLYSDNRGDFEEISTNSNLTSRQRELIGKLTRGRYLTIKDIRALGPDGRINELLPVILKID
jgi:gliding motility-associated protein GldM